MAVIDRQPHCQPMAVIDWHWQAEAAPSLPGHCGGGGGAVFGEGGKAEPQRCNSEAHRVNCQSQFASAP